MKIYRNVIKLTILLTSLASLSIAQANTPFDGFYTGAAIGGSLTNASLHSVANATLTQNPVILDFFTNSTTKEYLKKNSGLAALFAGYGYSCDPYYVGGELFFKINDANITNINIENTGSNSAGLAINLTDTASLKFRKTEFALDIRPGILLSDTNLLYARIGIANNKISLRVTESTSFALAGTITQVTLPLVQAESKNIFALRLGLGTEQMICECVGLRIDYIFTQYRRITLNANNSFTYVDPLVGLSTVSLTDTIKVKPTNHAIMLGLNYYW